MTKIELYGSGWCPDCLRTKVFLDRNHIMYQYFDVSKSKEASEKVLKLNNGKRIIPTIIIDGEAHTNPDNKQLMQILSKN